MSEQPRKIISFSEVEFSYGDKNVLSDLSLDFVHKGVNVVMGPSGCGKSTLLNLIGGRLLPQSGTVRVLDMDVPGLSQRDLYGLRRKMGMMFQTSALLTDLNVFENVAFPIRENTSLPESLIRKIVLLKLEQVGLRGTQSLMPSDLSGGMARRVALARATALDPELILYDEPFTGLDPISMGVITKLLHELNDALDATSILVTHDVPQGLDIADHVYLLGHGAVLASGTPQEMRECAIPEVEQFLHGLPDGPVPFHYPADDLRQDLLRAHR